MPMMRASERSRLLFAVLSPVFLLLCVVAIYGDESQEWTVYQQDFARVYVERAKVKLDEARAGGNAQEIQRWETVSRKAANLKAELKQIYVEQLQVADRCTTCHLGIDDPLFADAPQPFRTHSGKLLEKHDVNRLGCTVCHDGQGSATTLEGAHGHEENWAKPLLPAKLVQSACMRCHGVTQGVAGAERVSFGADLFMTKGCYGCHDVEGIEYKPKYSPPISQLRSKLTDPPRYIRAWLKQPTKIAPDTAMPDFRLSDEETGKITAFLLSLSKPAPAPKPATDGPAGSVEDGKRLVTERGCKGCHGIEPTEKSVSTRVPHLAGIASKVTTDWLDAWITDPKKYNPDTAMPKIPLEEAERRSVVAYLMTLKRTEALPDPGDLNAFKAADGRELVKQFECFGCHAVDGFETERPAVPNLGEFARRPIEQIDFGTVPDLPRTRWDWLRHKMREPRAFESEKIKLKMPWMTISDDEADAIIAYTIGLNPPSLPTAYAPPPTQAQHYVRNVSWMTSRLNCNGCHPLGGKDAHIAAYFERKSRVGPTLDGVGARLQGQYMYQYITEPKPVRPWLTLRMPTFGFTQDEGRQVVEGFAAVAGVNNPHTYVSAASIDQEHYDRGFRRFRFYKCIQCHPSSIDQGLPQGLDPDDLSINLMLSKTRLRPEWIKDFMARPKQLAGTQTRMPTVFYSVEGAPKVDRPDDDIADIVTYLMGMKEDAEITMKAYEEEQKAEEKKQDVDWSKMAY